MDKEFSKDELIHLLKKEIAENLLLKNEIVKLKDECHRHIYEWNNFQSNNNPSSVNSWLTIKNFFDTDKEIQNYHKDTGDELFRDGCFSATSHIIATIRKILSRVEVDD